MWRKLRITVLLYIAVMVAATSWSTRARYAEWTESLWVTIYPINGDGSAAAEQYISSLSETDFHPLEDYFVAQAANFKLPIRQPIEVKLSDPITTLPPSTPHAGSGLAVIFWSLKLRWWSWWENNFDGPSDIKIFVLFYDPHTSPRLRHSLGLQKGFLGVVHAFADESYNAQNQVVIGHELMHTLGASDQYDNENNYPLYPEGFVEPYLTPLFPQRKATLMAGRIPVSDSKSEMPKSLMQTVVSPTAAAEIGWSR
ncbi:MAG: hypothetical protein ACU84Q_21405 [Gammaproteobacteria bacterium]